MHAGLQVVGQLHTHPGEAHHSAGDLEGMRIRYPGYFSIVVPDYGSQLPSFKHAHILMWTPDGFRAGQPVGQGFRRIWAMNQQEFQRRLLERESRYPGWQVLPPNRVVHIHVDNVSMPEATQDK